MIWNLFKKSFDACCGYLAIPAICQLATSSEKNLVTSAQFLDVLVISELQFRALHEISYTEKTILENLTGELDATDIKYQ